MDNPDSSLGAEQMELATAGKPVAPTSWSVLAFGIQFKETPLMPWRQYKEFLQKPLMAGIFGFALQYFCNDMSNVVQKQRYGIITFTPYMVMFSILFLLSVLWWIIHVRHVKACQSLETLPLHRQDIQVNQTQQQLTQIINENIHAEDVQVDPGVHQTQQGFFIRTEEFCTLMDCWFSTRLGEMTRDEAMDRMRHLVEMGKRRSRGTSVVSTADDGQTVMSEPSETTGVERRHLSAGNSGYETQIGSTSPVLCPRVMERNNQARVRSLCHDGLVLKIPQNVDVGELVEIFDTNLPGCRELHRRIEIGPDHAGCSRESLVSQMLKSLRIAWTLDKDSTFQLGSFAIVKYTDAGIKCWLLQEDWTPTILDVRRSSQNFMDFFTGEKTNWTVRGFNLQSSTLRVATAEQTDNVTNVHHYKTENGLDVVLFKLPHSLPMFLDGVYVSASKTVEVQEGVSLKLHSQARKLQRAFWISVVDSIIPRPWTVILMASLSLLAHSFMAWNFAIFLNIVTACVYFSQGLRQGGDHHNGEPVTSPVEDSSHSLELRRTTHREYKLTKTDLLTEEQGGNHHDGESISPAEDSSNALESSTTTHREYKLASTDLLTAEQDEDPLPEIEGLQIVGHPVLGNTVIASGHSINGTTLCMFQWVRHYRNGTSAIIEGAEEPEYAITADDNDTIISVECVPLDERNRRGKLVTAFVNESRSITCGTLLQNEIDRYKADGYASFELRFLVIDGSLPEENWEAGTLSLMWNCYEIKRNPTKTVVVSEEYFSDVSISVDDLRQGRIKSHKGRSIYLRFRDSRSRDVGVLTFRLFQKMALDGKSGTCKVSAAGSKHQTEESESHTGDAKDGVFTFKKPEQCSGINKNKYFPQIWKLPGIPEPTLRLSPSGDSDNKSKGVTTSRNQRRRSTDKNDTAMDEVTELKTPQQHGSPSKNKYVPRVHELSERREPSFPSPSGTGSESGTDHPEDICLLRAEDVQCKIPSNTEHLPQVIQSPEFLEPALTTSSGNGSLKSDGDLPIHQITEPVEAFSTISRRSSSPPVEDELMKRDEPIDKPEDIGPSLHQIGSTNASRRIRPESPSLVALFESSRPRAGEKDSLLVRRLRSLLHRQSLQYDLSSFFAEDMSKEAPSSFVHDVHCTAKRMAKKLELDVNGLAVLKLDGFF